jgi:hypothetical protein
MTFRLLGLPEELRLAIEQANGSNTEEARLVYEAAVNEAVAQSTEQVNQSLREIQSIIGPHGAISRLQTGGVRITNGEGIGVYLDGVFKTNITPNGTVVIGSDISKPETTTEIFFVEDTDYNGEQFGAGDFLIGDNSTDTSNVKFNASEGQLQFRGGQTVKAYMDTDGSIKFGEGVGTLDEAGISILTPNGAAADSNSYKFVDASGNTLFKLAGYYSGTTMNALLETLHNGSMADSNLVIGTPTAKILISTVSDSIKINSDSNDIDTIIYYDTEEAVIIDGGTGKVFINAVQDPGSAYRLTVGGDMNLEGGTYDIDGTPHTHSEIAAHTGDTSDAHDASAISIADSGGYFTGTDVEAALQELGAGGGFTQEEIEDFVGAMFTGNITTNITSTYDDGSGKVSLEVAAIYSEITWQEMGTNPSTPASGEWVQYFKTDGMYHIDDTGKVNGPISAVVPETNAEVLFRYDNVATSAFVATIASKSGSTVTYNAPSGGNENVLNPFASTQLAKMRLYNTTRGDYALILSNNAGTNVITLTAAVPASWAATDTITIASQTVSGGAGNWVDFEITSGPTGKSALFVVVANQDTTTAGQVLRMHPFSTYGDGNVQANVNQVNARTLFSTHLIKITGNVFTVSWTASGATTAIVSVRETGYIG